MRISNKTTVGMLAATIAVSATLASAADMKGMESKKEAKMNMKAKKMDPEQAKMMEQMQKMSMPGEAHEKLKPLAGKWNYSASFWMKPGDKAQMTKGSSENSWVLGQRWLKQDVEGPPMAEGQPAFEGTGYLGYDNMRQEYTGIWIDNMVTGAMTATGQFDAPTQTLTQKGTMSCPMTGQKDMAVRSAWKIVDNDHNTYESWTTGPDGKEYKSMEIMYERAKLTQKN